MASKILRKISGELLLQLDLQNDGNARLAARAYADSLPRGSKLSDEIVLACRCIGMDDKVNSHKKRFKCCDRAGEYNGFDSGTRLFICPQGCGCHD